MGRADESVPRSLHDVYSLGVTLLEIGLWQVARKLDRNGMGKIEYSHRFEIQAFFRAPGEREAAVHGRLGVCECGRQVSYWSI